MICPHDAPKRPPSEPAFVFAPLVLSLLCAAPRLASAGGDRRVAFPLEMGVVLATSEWDLELPGDARPLHAGVLAGAGVAMLVTRTLALQVGLGYEARGVVLEYWVPSRDESGEDPHALWFRGSRRVNYICLPITVVASLHREALAPYLRAGAETGFFVSGKSHAVYETQTERDAEDQSIHREEVHPTDFSALLGVGVQSIRGAPVFAEVRYLHGLRDQFKGLTEWKQRVILMVLGVRL